MTPGLSVTAPRGSPPIKVLFAKDRLHETGGTLYYLHVLPHLDPARVTPLLCAFASRHPIAERFEAIGIKPTFFGRTRWDPRSLRDVLQFARGHHVDLVHLDGPTSFPFGRLGACLTRLPTIAHFHSMLELPPVRALLNRQPMLSTSRSIAVSAAVREWAIAALAIAPERIELFYDGHDIDRYASPSVDAHSRIRREFALADNLPVVAVVGRLDIAQKGQDVMIRALPALREHCPGVALLLVGAGPDRARCEALVNQLGLVDAVHFGGHRDDIPDLLAAVDVVAAPSMCEEAFSLAALEACAAGRPVVAFETGGLTEVVLHEQTGIVVPKGDIAGLSEAIARLLDNPDLAKRLGEGGRRHAARFGLSQHVSELTDFFEAVLDEHRRSKGMTSMPGERSRRDSAITAMASSHTGGAFMTPFLQGRFDKLRNQLSDRFLEFKPYIKPLAIDGCPIRFFYATAQAASWYDPLKERNRRELEWLIANIAPAGQRIMDAGAYHGLYATVFAKAAGERGKVVAVDPVPSNQAVIEVNLAINGLRGRIETCAISNADGEVGFSSASCGHIVARGGVRRPSRRLRSILPDATIVKLDIEGAEFDVLPAQIDELPAARVWIVEIHPGQGRNPATVLDAFRMRPFDLWWGHPVSGRIKPYAGEPWTTRTTLVAIRRN